jgi:hypothetical protein
MEQYTKQELGNEAVHVATQGGFTLGMKQQKIQEFTE